MRPTGRKVVLWAVAGVAALAVFGTFLPRARPPESPPPSDSTRSGRVGQPTPKDLAFYLGHEIIDNFRNPRTTRFTLAAAMADGSYCFDLRSQNQHGGMTEGRIVKVGTSVWMWDQDSGGQPGFRTAWDVHCARKRPRANVADALNYYAKNNAP
jgi:hypothetical protein